MVTLEYLILIGNINVVQAEQGKHAKVPCLNFNGHKKSRSYCVDSIFMSPACQPCSDGKI